MRELEVGNYSPPGLADGDFVPAADRAQAPGMGLWTELLEGYFAPGMKNDVPC